MKKIPWEPWEEDFLREVASSMSIWVISEKLERTIRSIQSKASRIKVKLTFLRNDKKWAADEIALFDSLSAEEISEKTSRSIYSVRSKRYSLSRSASC